MSPPLSRDKIARKPCGQKTNSTVALDHRGETQVPDGVGKGTLISRKLLDGTCTGTNENMNVLSPKHRNTPKLCLKLLFQ